MTCRQLSFVGLLILTMSTPRGALAIDGCQVVDLNGNGSVDKEDFIYIEAELGRTTPRYDLDASGLVDDADVAILWSYRKTCARSCPADLDRDGVVGAYDRRYLEAFYGLDCQADLNRDGQICPRDSEVMSAYLGSRIPLSASAARADLDRDGDVDQDDAKLLINQEMTNCASDINRDGAVDTNDLAHLLAEWGPCKGPITVRAKGDPENTCDVGSGS